MKTILKLLLLSLSLFSFDQSAAQTQAEMNKQALDDYKKTDAELNKVYQGLLKNLDDKEKKLLVTAQKAWLKFRDSHCGFEVQGYEGGSIQPLMYSTCLKEITEVRIENLKASIESRTGK